MSQARKDFLTDPKVPPPRAGGEAGRYASPLPTPHSHHHDSGHVVRRDTLTLPPDPVTDLLSAGSRASDKMTLGDQRLCFTPRFPPAQKQKPRRHAQATKSFTMLTKVKTVDKTGYLHSEVGILPPATSPKLCCFVQNKVG